jgi:transposase
MPRSRIALETGMHSPWVSRLLSASGHEVIVAHARNVRLIGESGKKDDRLDAQTLARLARIDPELLCPVKHRSAQAQADLTVIRARAGLVRARTALVNTARGLAKSYGERLRGCNVRNLNPEKAEGLSAELQQALGPLLLAAQSLSEQIAEYNERIEQLAKQSYPQVALFKQVKGVGTEAQRNVAGDVAEWPTEAHAWQGSKEFRYQRMEQSCGQAFGALVKRYMHEAMPERYSTRKSYASILKRHILPQWGG